MNITYEAAKALKADAEAQEERAGKTLQDARGTESGPMGLTPDHVKASKEYQEAYANHARAFRQMQSMNSWFNRTFKREYAAERRATMAARLSSLQPPTQIS